jgi:SAM-dependent methyltransferase
VTAFHRAEGRHVFGADPAFYDRARPRYPERVFEVLRDRCGLAPGKAVLEIGPGPGTATRRLLELGADPLVAVEPNRAFAAYLAKTTAGVVSPIVASFEEAKLPESSFDLATAATSFHWIDPEIGLRKVRDLLRSGGWWAMWANLHGDQTEHDAFHRATTHVLGPSPAVPWRSALDADAHLEELAAAGFDEADHELIRWQVEFDADGIRDLYATFSPIARLPERERERLLDAVAQIAEAEFGGAVERAILTPLYTARRPTLSGSGGREA